MALPKVHRLKHRQDFQHVYQQGICCGGRYLVVRALSSLKPTPSLENHTSPPLSSGEQPSIKPTQIGISISRKVSKKAVVRNRIKRRIRAVFLELLPEISPGWKIVVVVRSPAIECEYEHFLRELKKLLRKAEIINGY